MKKNYITLNERLGGVNESDDVVVLNSYDPITLEPYVKNGRFTVKFPDVINGDFVLEGLWLTSLKGCPSVIKGNFICTMNDVETLEGGPKRVDGWYICGNILKNFNGLATNIGKGLFCVDTDFKSLEGVGLPRIMRHSFNLENNENLTSLKGCPEVVQGDFIISNSSISTLEGGPKRVGGNYICEYNSDLESLKGAPEVTHGHFVCYDNLLKFDKSDLPDGSRVKGKFIDNKKDQNRYIKV